MKKPTIPEIQERIDKMGYVMDAEEFFCHHGSKGWKIGSGSMKNWKLAVTTWWIRGGRKTKVKPIDNREDQWEKQAGAWLRTATLFDMQGNKSFKDNLSNPDYKAWAEGVNELVKEI